MRINKVNSLLLDNSVEIFAGSLVSMKLKYYGWTTGTIDKIADDSIKFRELGNSYTTNIQLNLIEEVEGIE